MPRMDVTRMLGLGALVLALVGCTAQEAPEPDREPEPVVTTPANPPADPAPEPTPEATPEPEVELSPEDDYIATVRDVATSVDISLGSADDTALLAAGQHACEVYDIGGSYPLAASLTVTDLPDDVDPDGHYLAAFVAAGKLCTDHWERVKAEEASANS